MSQDIYQMSQTFVKYFPQRFFVLIFRLVFISSLHPSNICATFYKIYFVKEGEESGKSFVQTPYLYKLPARHTL